MTVTTRRILAALIGAALAGSIGAARAEMVRVGTPSADDFHFSMANVGVDTGIFKKYGLELQINAFAGGAKLHQAITAGSIDIGLGAGTDLGLIAKGAPEIGVGTLAGKPSNFVLQVSTLSKITKVEQLKGKKIGVSSVGALTYWFGQQLMRHEGWGPNGMTLVATGGGQGNIAGFVTGSLDGAVTSLEAALKVERAGQGRILLSFGDIIHPFVAHIIFASNDMVAHHPDTVRRFLKGWYETIAFARAHKAEALHYSQKATHLPDDLANKVYDLEMPTFSSDGKFDLKAIEAVKEALVDLGQLKEKPDNKTLITERFLK